METNDQTILIYHNPSSQSGHVSSLMPIALAITEHVRQIDVTQEPVTQTIMAQILTMTDAHPRDLINPQSRLYQEKYADKDFDEHEWLNILRVEPELWGPPVAIRGDKAVICRHGYDINQLKPVGEV